MASGQIADKKHEGYSGLAKGAEKTKRAAAKKGGAKEHDE